MRPETSCSVKKLALPITRRNITRPATDDFDRLRLQVFLRACRRTRLQIGRVRGTAKIVRKRFSGRAQRREFFAPVPDDLVFFVITVLPSDSLR